MPNPNLSFVSLSVGSFKTRILKDPNIQMSKGFHSSKETKDTSSVAIKNSIIRVRKIYPVPVFNFLLFLLLIAGANFIISCGPKSIPESDIAFLSEYDNGVALARTNDNCWYFINENLMPVTEEMHIMEIDENFKDGLTTAKIKRHNEELPQFVVFDRQGNIALSSSSSFKSEILPGGRIWVASDDIIEVFDWANPGTAKKPAGIRLVDIPNGRILFEEYSIEVKSCSKSGTSVLSRTFYDIHPKWNNLCYYVEFMLVGNDGNIIAPWGEIGYIGNFANGLAPVAFGEAGRRMQSDRVFAGESAFDVSKLGFIDETGKLVIKPRFEEVTDFNDEGYARVMFNRKAIRLPENFKYINRKGQLLSGHEEKAAQQSYLNAQNTRIYY